MNKKIFLLIFGIIFTFLAIGAYIVFVGNMGTPQSGGLGLDFKRINPVQNKEQSEASINALVESSETQDDSVRSLNIVLDAQGKNIAGIALRLSYEYGQGTSLDIKDANLQKEGVQVRPDSNLVNAGWAYPVNEVYVDSAQGKVFVDVALVNLKPEGYTPTGKITVASFDFATDTSFSSENFTFDPEQTKVMTKDAKSLNLDLKEASFNVE